jgi:hypothetical protein
MRFFQFLLLASALMLLAGCFQVDTVVRINSDGSGTVEEKVMLSKKLLAQMTEMMKGFAQENGATPKTPDLFETAKLKEQARTMGDGVTFVSGEKMATADFEGYRAVYAFKDINKLLLSQNKEALAGGTAPAGAKPSRPFRFLFSKGSPATLTIVQPRGPKMENTATVGNKQADQDSKTNGKVSDAEAAQLKELFGGMEMSIVVEVNGTIIATNAAYRDGKRITLLDFDMGKLIGSADKLEKLQQLDPASLENSMQLLKDIPGVKIDTNEELHVKFRK